MKTQWTKGEPMRDIAIIVINFFDDLGKFIIESKETGEELGFNVIIPSYVDRMKEVAKAADFIRGDFNCGTSADVANALWNANVGLHPGVSMSYYEYVEKLCKEFHNIVKE